jgi:hypothetical protein
MDAMPKRVRLLAPANAEVPVECPSEAMLAAHAKRLNEILRECRIKDEFRPMHAATFVLGLWRSEVASERSVVLSQINANARLALQKAGKSALANILRVDEENAELATHAREIIDILTKLHIRSLPQNHDYLGRLYETFFRYTGGNTIGQYFTPRHIIEFMCELVDVRPGDRVFDPACGTGGFLIGALSRAARNLAPDDPREPRRGRLFGIESEPATAALCVTNMLLRGHTTDGVVRDNCFTNTAFPAEAADCALMNPPFPHRKTDTPTTDFIDRALHSLKRGGHLATIVPYSLLVNAREWHRTTLRKHTLLFAATLPADLFSPYASFNTAILILQKGIAHAGKRVFFARATHDGFKLKKSVRVPGEPGLSQLAQILRNYLQNASVPEVCAVTAIDENTPEWSPEAFIESAPYSREEFAAGLQDSIRDHASFYVRHGSRLLPSGNTIAAGIAAAPEGFSVRHRIPISGSGFSEFRVADYFDVELGGSAEIEDLAEGISPIVSTSELMNGVTAWRKAPSLNAPPCITVATDGSTCSSFVQEYPFYAFYKVAILRARPGVNVPVDALYYVAYLLRRQKWRYVYARKFGKARISQTTLYAPARSGRPDFQRMAQIVRSAAAFPILESFREAFTQASRRATRLRQSA